MRTFLVLCVTFALCAAGNYQHNHGQHHVEGIGHFSQGAAHAQFGQGGGFHGAAIHGHGVDLGHGAGIQAQGGFGGVNFAQAQGFGPQIAFGGHQPQERKVVTIVKEVPVRIPQPYPVTVTKEVKVGVPQPYPVHIPKPYPVPVRVVVPVQVPKPYPVKITQQVPVRVPVYVKVPHPVRVEVPVPKPYPVEVVKHVPVNVPTPVYVKVPVRIHTHTHQIQTNYAPAQIQTNFAPAVSQINTNYAPSAVPSINTNYVPSAVSSSNNNFQAPAAINTQYHEPSSSGFSSSHGLESGSFDSSANFESQSFDTSAKSGEGLINIRGGFEQPQSFSQGFSASNGKW